MTLNNEFIKRNKKEKLGFMFAKFLHAYDLFNEIYDEYEHIIHRNESGQSISINDISFEGSTLFDKVRYLEEGKTYEIKNIAHFLFREGTADEIKKRCTELYESLEQRLSQNQPSLGKAIMSDILTEQIKESLDWIIGQEFHHLMILRENLYLLKEYEPHYKDELRWSEKIASMVDKQGYIFSEDEKQEFFLIKELDKASDVDITETKANVIKSIPHLKERFERTAELLSHYILRISDPETLYILGKNIMVNYALVEKIYGKERAEKLKKYTKS